MPPKLIPPRALVVTHSKSHGGFVLCGFARMSNRPIIGVYRDWIEAMTEGSLRVSEVGCELFIADDILPMLKENET